MYNPGSIESVRRRQERAIRYVTGRTGYIRDDPDKCMRATYVIVMNDVPALLTEIEWLRKIIRELQGEN